MTKIYAMVPVAEMTGNRWDDVMETPSSVSAPSSDGRCIIKWNGDDPIWFAALGVPTYDEDGTHAKIAEDIAAVPGMWGPLDPE